MKYLIFLLFLVLTSVVNAQSPNILSLINTSSNKINFEKYMLTSNCVLVELKLSDNPTYIFLYKMGTRYSQLVRDLQLTKNIIKSHFRN
jgi:hypothetical protein